MVPILKEGEEEMAKINGQQEQGDASGFLTKDLTRRMRRSTDRKVATATLPPPKHDVHNRRTPGHTAFTPPMGRSSSMHTPTVRVIMSSGSVHAVGKGPGKERVIDYRQVMFA